MEQRISLTILLKSACSVIGVDMTYTNSSMEAEIDCILAV